MAFQNVHAPLQAPQQYIDKYSFIEDENHRTYAGMVNTMDEAIGNITEAVKDAGLTSLPHHVTTVQRSMRILSSLTSENPA